MTLDARSQAFFSQIALLGPAMFFEAAVPPTELDDRFETLRPATARDFFLLRTLAEVQKFGFASLRWTEERARAEAQEKIRDVRLESVVLEECAWMRRLLEALVTLICFARTNEHPYYFHYLALAEYDRARRAVADERDFFAALADSTRLTADSARARLDEALAALPDPRLCWYLTGDATPRLVPLRDRYKLAIIDASPTERRSLGYTYDASFGAASDSLHFSVQRGTARRKALDAVAMPFCGMLAISLIVRAHELSGTAPRGINVAVLASHARNTGRDLPVVGNAEVGDFVLIEGPHLAEVLGVETSAVGYEGYRVRVLSDGAVGRLLTLPAPAVSSFMRRREMIADLAPLLGPTATITPPFTDDEVSEALREAVLTVWTYAGPSLLKAATPQPPVHGT